MYVCMSVCLFVCPLSKKKSLPPFQEYFWIEFLGIRWATTVDVGCQWQGGLASHPVSLWEGWRVAFLPGRPDFREEDGLTTRPNRAAAVKGCSSCG